jgi:hypothetical protein
MMGRWGVDEKAGRSSPGGVGYAPSGKYNISTGLENFLNSLLCYSDSVRKARY